MSAQEKFAWQPGDLRPGWFCLVDREQQATLLQLLATAPLSRHEQANRMLGTPPWPTDADDAQARIATVIEFLTGGYRVGDPHPSVTEDT